jgi:protein-L-isoaspartate(D-aspartate) O-methyltransferase
MNRLISKTHISKTQNTYLATSRFVNALIVCVVVIFGGVESTQAAPQGNEYYRQLRTKMVDVAVRGAGVTDERVLRSMLATPRHEFVPKKIRKYQSYLDAGIPIGEKQTISSPFIVAYMTESLDPKSTDKVLEIGTGSGYQAAILSPLVAEVYSIEIVEQLGKRAAKVLEKLKYKNVFTKIGDGYKGWKEHAPFDKIIVTCSPEDIPQPLIDQLKEGGVIVVPMGERHQQTLYLMEKKDGEMVRSALRPTLFVPMTGAAEDKRKVLPDPTNPKLLNGDFEEGLDEEGFAKGWYYQRKLEWINDADAPSGKHFVQFKNKVPGQLSHVMQAFAIDGRQVPVIKLGVSIACEDVIVGPHQNDLPCVVMSLYDAQREELATVRLGPFRGTMNWKHLNKEIRVPRGTREAIVRIGLFGATGVARYDNLMVKAVR